MTEVRPVEDPKPFLLTVADYLALAEAGAFEERGRVELIEGVILQIAPQQSVHSYLKIEIAARLRLALEQMGSRLRVYGDPTVKMPPHSAPEPDIAVSSEPPDYDYLTCDGIALLVEIANTSVEHDLGRKAALYASHGVPEYWVLEVRARCVHRHWEPGGDGYGCRDEVKLGGQLESATIAGLAIDTANLV